MSSPETTDFLDRLSSRDPASARLARELLDAGWAVRDLFGPEQMDVWQLLLHRGTCTVRFGMERGYSDGVHVADSTGAYRPLAAAMSVTDPGIRVPADATAVIDWLKRQAGASES
ncbi:hypothetical protein [Microbacterium sp. W4I20]|uniref:hypothetical protein n=1 Tax=Microbacterium sp. W4I20 TaxID=3042262 RepID=UPI002784F764|nr:hypothetical protein [Microbacterium sp. W4I20]MDQ0727338.1 hypothetical protein [Microbacterium sp. W4I20]